MQKLVAQRTANQSTSALVEALKKANKDHIYKAFNNLRSFLRPKVLCIPYGRQYAASFHRFR
jgi:hypothetical protein